MEFLDVGCFVLINPKNHWPVGTVFHVTNKNLVQNINDVFQPALTEENDENSIDKKKLKVVGKIALLLIQYEQTPGRF